MKRKKPRILKLLGTAAGFLAIAVPVLLMAVALYLLLRSRIPTIDEIVNQSSARSTILLYSNGVERIKSYNESGLNRIKFDDIPVDMVNALVATEDRKFFSHRGVDLAGILRAMVVNLKSGHLRQGGSTLTQQLSKIILRDNRRTLGRKIRELILTIELEKYLTKNVILTLYLAKSYFGAGQYGVRDASRFYFGKELDELGLQECAMLIGLLKAPTRYSPFINRDLAIGRMIQVLTNMRNAGFMDESDFLISLIPDLSLSSTEGTELQVQNRYFVDWLDGQLKDLDIDRGVDNISVLTTLDIFIQSEVIGTLNRFIKEYGNRLKNAEIAILVMRKNGEVLSMVGGKNYHQSQFNRVVQARRQTGSLFKLFVYMAGFEKGLGINDNFIDEPIKIGKWYPENYGRRYEGQITVKEAFINSSNSVAVQIANYFGIDSVIEIAKKSGLKGKFRKDMTISLGSQESTLMEMVAAYAALLNDGIPVIPHGIKNIDSDQGPIYQWNQPSGIEPIFSRETAEKILYLLYSTINEGTGRRAKVTSLLDKTLRYNIFNSDNKFFIGGKTGSTQNNNDAWFLGFADDLVLGIWIGNDDNSPMDGIMGGNLPAELWKSIIESINN
ncbi:MAG: transglycosylase domain-containing protein [Rickettsiales bacterium]|nr:transglycosylase domain-containing protein [Rickettsiales bacterium]